MKLVASAIVANEEHRYLDLWLAHLLSFCDEVRLIDDRSDDETPWIASRYSNVKITTNQGEPFIEHESAARNELLRWTLEANPTYVLSIDADEFVSSPSTVRRIMSLGKPVYTLQMDEVWSCNEYSLGLRVDGLWGPRKCPILWKAPSKLGPEWLIPDRKLACGREPQIVRQTKFQVSGSSVLHFGWTRKAEREARAERYYIHDQGKFHQDRHLQSILWPDDRVIQRGVEWPEGLEPWRTELAARAQ